MLIMRIEMRKLWFLIVMLACLGTTAQAVSIFDIQHSSTPGVDNTYPSLYVGKIVTIEGIVTAPGYKTGGYFISEPSGGPYRGILVMDRRNNPRIGDKLRITGTVSETYGMTCIENISKIRVIDSNHPLPQPMFITTGQISSYGDAEPYEGVQIKVQNVSCSSVKGGKGKFFVTDGTGQCSVNLTTFSSSPSLNPSVGSQFSSISGIVVFAFGEYSVNTVNSNGIGIQAPVYNQNRSWGKIKSIYK